MKQLAIVTGNTGKYTQIAAVLSNVVDCTQYAIDLFEPQTHDMLAISRTKAQEAFTKLALPVLVDDSGIYFDAYPDFPGVFSKYLFTSLGIEGLRRLFIEEQNNRAYFQCVLSYMDATLDEPVQFVGRVYGVIDFGFLDQVTIDAHLPYDAIFRSDEMQVVAQLDMHAFGTLHHRTQAAQLCKERLKDHEDAL